MTRWTSSRRPAAERLKNGAVFAIDRQQFAPLRRSARLPAARPSPWFLCWPAPRACPPAAQPKCCAIQRCRQSPRRPYPALGRRSPDRALAGPPATACRPAAGRRRIARLSLSHVATKYLGRKRRACSSAMLEPRMSADRQQLQPPSRAAITSSAECQCCRSTQRPRRAVECQA